MGRYISASVVLLCLAMPAAAAPVTAEFNGDWVATSAACTAPLRARIAGARLTLVNGADIESFDGTEMAPSGYFGPDYTGIQQVAIAEFEGAQPVTVTFNINEKKGVAQFELAVPTPAHPANKVAAVANARLAKLNLRKRFALHGVPLKRCPATGRGGGR